MKVLVCGGRDYADAAKVAEVLSSIDDEHGITLVIHGGASGADSLADEWAKGQGIHRAKVEALWDYYNKAAGPIRNKHMVMLNPDLIVVFPGGSGTDHMIDTAEAKGLKVRRVY